MSATSRVRFAVTAVERRDRGCPCWQSPGRRRPQQLTPARRVTYRWVDDQGVVHYGDQVPPQYAQKEHTVLNTQGVEVKRLDAQKTPEQQAADARKQRR